MFPLTQLEERYVGRSLGIGLKHLAAVEAHCWLKSLALSVHMEGLDF